MLQVQNLCKSFGGLVAVRDCSFDIAEGRITGLIGPNGAGKTTTFNVIAGAMKPDSGKIVFRGEDVTGLPAHVLFRKGVVRTFQIPHEFAQLTVLENLMAVPAGQIGENLLRAWFTPASVAVRESVVRAEADSVLDFLHLEHLRDERAGNLSGGQKKLMELGRAMMTEAKLVLLDEPGAGVNPTLLSEMASMITHLNQQRGFTFCIIEHNLDMIARLCDPVIVMAEGTVLTEGKMADVRADQRVLDAYLGGGEAA